MTARNFYLVFVDAVNQAVFLSDAPRPPTAMVSFQQFRLAQTRERVL